ncbi:LysR family substrate-binding domain-containing protein [Kitasatospora sp. NPDC101155]|uniref:LysR family substrate-binding domain-containing protein n=1 Tax=Kitasatospora sp. NPDC101155 TaxID=3364097 RepID=UPI0037F59551
MMTGRMVRISPFRISLIAPPDSRLPCGRASPWISARFCRAREKGEDCASAQFHEDVAFITSAAVIVSERLRAFSLRCPDVRVRLHDGFTVDVLTALERGTADIGIVRDIEECDDIDLALLTTERFVAVVPADHPAAEGDRVEAAALATDPLIPFPRSAGARAFDVNTQPIRGGRSSDGVASVR